MGWKDRVLLGSYLFPLLHMGIFPTARNEGEIILRNRHHVLPGYLGEEVWVVCGRRGRRQYRQAELRKCIRRIDVHNTERYKV